MGYAAIRERDGNGRFVVPSIPSGFDKKEYRKKRYLVNKEKILSKTKEWAKNNPEKRKEIRNRWRAKNRPLTNFLARNAFYRKDGVTGYHSFAEENDLMEKFGGICAYCPKKANGIDHVVPIRRGGTNDISNILPCCYSCNSLKKNRTLEELNPELAKKYAKS